MRLTLIILCFWLSLGAGPALAHPDDPVLPPDADKIVLPEVIEVLDFVRYNRVDHQVLLVRIDRGDRHQVGMLSPVLTAAAAWAGAHSPRRTSRLVWEMSEIRDEPARQAYLTDQMTDLRNSLAELRQDPLAVEHDFETVNALLHLVRIWLADPMDGV